MGKQSWIAASVLLVAALACLGGASARSSPILDGDWATLSPHHRSLLTGCGSQFHQLYPTSIGQYCVSTYNECPLYSTLTTDSSNHSICTCNADRLLNIHTKACVTPTECLHNGDMHIDASDKLCKCRAGTYFNTFTGMCVAQSECPGNASWNSLNTTCTCSGTNDWYLPSLNTCITEGQCPRKMKTKAHQAAFATRTYQDSNLETLTTGFNVDWQGTATTTRTYILGSKMESAYTLSITDYQDIDRQDVYKWDPTTVTATADPLSLVKRERRRVCDCADPYINPIVGNTNAQSNDWILQPQMLCVDPYLGKDYKFEVDQNDNSVTDFKDALELVNDRIITDVWGAIRDIRRVGFAESTVDYCRRGIGCLPGLYWSPSHNKCIRGAECPFNMTTTDHGEIGPMCFCQAGWVWEPTFKMCRPRDCRWSVGADRPFFNWHTWTCDTSAEGALTDGGATVDTEEKVAAYSGCPKGASYTTASGTQLETQVTGTVDKRVGDEFADGPTCYCDANKYYSVETNACVSVGAGSITLGAGADATADAVCPKGATIYEADHLADADAMGSRLFQSCMCPGNTWYVPAANACKSTCPSGSVQTTNHGLGNDKACTCTRGLVYHEETHSCRAYGTYWDEDFTSNPGTPSTAHTATDGINYTPTSMCDASMTKVTVSIAHDDFLGLLSLDDANADTKIKSSTLDACYGKIEACVCAPHEDYNASTGKCETATAPYVNACTEAGITLRPWEMLGHVSTLRYGATPADGGWTAAMHAHTDVKCLKQCPAYSTADSSKMTCTCNAGYYLDRNRNQCVAHASMCAKGSSNGLTKVLSADNAGKTGVVSTLTADGTTTTTMNGPAELDGLLWCGCKPDEYYWEGRHICTTYCDGAGTYLTSNEYTTCDNWMTDETCEPKETATVAPHLKCGCLHGLSDTESTTTGEAVDVFPAGTFMKINGEGYFNENYGKCVGYCPLENSIIDPLKRTCRCLEGYWYDVENHLCHASDKADGGTGADRGCPTNSYKYPNKEDVTSTTANETDETVKSSYPNNDSTPADNDYNDSPHICKCNAGHIFHFHRNACMSEDECPFKNEFATPASPPQGAASLFQAGNVVSQMSGGWYADHLRCQCPPELPWWYKMVDSAADLATGETLSTDYKNRGVCMGSCPEGSTMNKETMACDACSGIYHKESHECIATSGDDYTYMCGDPMITPTTAANYVTQAVKLSPLTEATAGTTPRQYTHLGVCSCAAANAKYNYHTRSCQQQCPSMPKSTTDAQWMEDDVYDEATNVCRCPAGLRYAPGIDACIDDCPSNALMDDADADYNGTPTCICDGQTKSTSDSAAQYMLSIGVSFVDIDTVAQHAGSKKTSAAARNAHNGAKHVCIAAADIPTNVGTFEFQSVGTSRTDVSSTDSIKGLVDDMGYSDTAPQTYAQANAATAVKAEARGVQKGSRTVSGLAQDIVQVTINRAAASVKNSGAQATARTAVTYNDIACQDWFDPVRKLCVNSKYMEDTSAQDVDTGPTKYACAMGATRDATTRQCSCPSGTPWVYNEYPICMASCPANSPSDSNPATDSTTLKTCTCPSDGSIKRVFDFHKHRCVSAGWYQSAANQGGSINTWTADIDTTDGTVNNIPRSATIVGVLSTGAASATTAFGACTSSEGCKSGGVAICTSRSTSTDPSTAIAVSSEGYYDSFRHMCVNGCPAVDHLPSTEAAPPYNDITGVSSTEGCPAGQVTRDDANDKCYCNAGAYFHEYTNTCLTQAECETISGATASTSGDYNQCTCASGAIYEWGTGTAGRGTCHSASTDIDTTTTGYGGDEFWDVHTLDATEAPCTGGDCALRAKFGSATSFGIKTAACRRVLTPPQIWDPDSTIATDKELCKMCPKNAAKTQVTVSIDTAVAAGNTTPVGDKYGWKCSCATSGNAYLWPAFWDSVGCTTCASGDGMSVVASPSFAKSECECATATPNYLRAVTATGTTADALGTTPVHKCIAACGTESDSTSSKGYQHSFRGTTGDYSANYDLTSFSVSDKAPRWSYLLVTSSITDLATANTYADKNAPWTSGSTTVPVAAKLCVCPTNRYYDADRNVCLPKRDLAYCEAAGSFYIPHLDNPNTGGTGSDATGATDPTYRVCIETAPTDSSTPTGGSGSKGIRVCDGGKYYHVPSNKCVSATATECKDEQDHPSTTAVDTTDVADKDEHNRVCKCTDADGVDGMSWKWDKNQSKCVPLDRCPVNGFLDNFSCHCTLSNPTQYHYPFDYKQPIPDMCLEALPEGASSSSTTGMVSACSSYYNIHENKCQSLDACPKQMKYKDYSTSTSGVDTKWTTLTGTNDVCMCNSRGAFGDGSATPTVSDDNLVSGARYYDTRTDLKVGTALDSYASCVDAYACHANNDRNDWLDFTTTGSRTAAAFPPTLPTDVSNPVAGDNVVAAGTMSNLDLTCKCPPNHKYMKSANLCLPTAPSNNQGESTTEYSCSGLFYDVHNHACVGEGGGPLGATYHTKGSSLKMVMCADLGDYNSELNSCYETEHDYDCAWSFPAPPPINLLGTRVEFVTNWPALNCGRAHDLFMRGKVSVGDGDGAAVSELDDDAAFMLTERKQKRDYIDIIRMNTCQPAENPTEVGVSHVTCADDGTANLHTHVVFSPLKLNHTVAAFLEFLEATPGKLLTVDEVRCEDLRSRWDMTLADVAPAAEEPVARRALLQDEAEAAPAEDTSKGSFGNWGEYTVSYDQVLTMRLCNDYPWKEWMLAFFIIFFIFFCCTFCGLGYLLKKHGYCGKKGGNGDPVNKVKAEPMAAAEA